MWRSRLFVDTTTKEKKKKKQRRRRRQTQAMTINTEFTTTNDVHEHCDRYMLANRVRSQLLKDIETGVISGDAVVRDYKTVKYEDRTPASHRFPVTPPGYWQIDSPNTPVTS